MVTAGIAGTAKNTGKTTTLAAVSACVRQKGGLTLALTSIGWDGEDFDNVTGLAKPRVDVFAGDIVATSQGAAKFSSAALKPLKATEIKTPLGKVEISRVAGAGKVVLAGANNRADLAALLAILRGTADITVVDGALSRMAPLAEADCLILATGAARNADIPSLAREAGCQADILSAPKMEPRGKVAASGSVLSFAGFSRFLEKCLAADTVRLNGVIAGQYLKELASFSEALAGKRLIFDDPVKILLCGVEAADTLRSLEALLPLEIGVEKPAKLLGLTVNPYYPKYRPAKSDYEAAYVDADEILREVSARVNAPCFDIKRGGERGLFKLLAGYLPGFSGSKDKCQYF